MKKIDLTGQTYGRLLALRESGVRITPRGTRKTMWVCICKCGNEVIASTADLRSGHTNSCGCYQREQTSKASIRHGMKHTRVYKEWIDMRQRCSNPHNKRYKRYGGRGIKVCEEWNGNGSFETFYGFVSKLPHFGEKGYTLDRIDNNGNYEPGNVRFATNTEQANNRGNVIKIFVEGRYYTIRDLSNITGIPYSKLYRRQYDGRQILRDKEMEDFWNGIKNTADHATTGD